MLAQFDQIQLRESEAKELEQLIEHIPCDVKVSVHLLPCSFSLHVFTGRHRY